MTCTSNRYVKVNHVANRKGNPAKRYLIAGAVLCLLGTIVSLVGLIDTLRQGPVRVLFMQSMAFIAFSVFCATSAYLAFGDFGKVNRIFTIVWALVAALGIGFVITYVDPTDPTDARNLPGMLVLAGCFALLGYIAWLCAFADATALAPDIMTTEN